MTNFYDTSSLLLNVDNLFDTDAQIVLSSITLKELEKIKTSANKDINIKYTARQLLHKLDENPDKFICWIFRDYMLEPIKNYNLEITDDMKILATALDYELNCDPNNVTFYTNDLSLKNIAALFFGQNYVKSIIEISDNYTGYQKLIMTDEEMANFYSRNYSGIQCKVNEYINIYNTSNELVDTYCWTGQEFRKLKYYTFSSKWLGDIKPIKNDIYQALAADSFINNQITMIKGPAGTGKSLLSMAFLLSLLEKGKIDKIIIFCNPVATKNSARLGFLPGTRDEKLLDSQIGNFLISKLGGRLAVEKLIDNEQLLLLPFSDIRGYDTSGMNAGIYITEAQNLDISLLKLALQRIGEDSICIIDGDEKTQVDLIDYEGINNGMRRMSEVFRGQDIYGEVTLQQIHRSKISEIANRM